MGHQEAGYQIRQNPLTREWVIYATRRGDRPNDFQRAEGEKPEAPSLDPDCPFCPGNDARLSSVVSERPGSGTHFWQTRVVPNKFPALSSDHTDTTRRQDGPYTSLAGYGVHDVIIESPMHNRDLSQMDDQDIFSVVETYHARYTEVMSLRQNMLGIIFRNHGKEAGTSLIHPHSQFVATGIVPVRTRRREEEMQRYFDQWGRCACCDILEHEGRVRLRTIQENDAFLAFVPYAAEVPCEIWVVPKRHEADFGDATERERFDLAQMMGGVLRRLRRKMNDPDYNYVFQTFSRFRAGTPPFHWYLQIRPRLTTPAGFEIGSGVPINPSLPEKDAAMLRSD